MRFARTISVVGMAVAIAIAGVFVANVKETHATTINEALLKIGSEYNYDIDGDGDLDSIRTYREGKKLMIKVNNCVRVVDNKYYPSLYEYSVNIYDFAKKDKSAEIVITKKNEETSAVRIMKFKNNKCLLNKLYKDARVFNYNDSTGVVWLLEYSNGRFSEFKRVLGGFECYDRIQIDGYKVKELPRSETTYAMRENKFRAAKNITAYMSVNGKSKAYTLKEGQMAYAYELYQKGNVKYIKIKNKHGRYGYVKVVKGNLFKPATYATF